MADDLNNGEIEEIGLDFNLDDIEDLPEFKTFPTGAYRVRLEEGIVRKYLNDDKKKPIAEVAMTLLEVIELDEKNLQADIHEEAPKPGDISTSMYMLNNKFGAGNYKKQFLLPLSGSLGTKVLGEIEAGSKGMTLGIIVKRQPDKKDPDVLRMRVQQVVVD